MENHSKILTLLICLLASLSSWGQTDSTLGTEEWNDGWTAIDGEVVYVNPEGTKVRAGSSEIGYFEGDFHQSYINEATFVFKKTCDHDLYCWIDYEPNPQATSSHMYELTDNTYITITDITQFLHIYYQTSSEGNTYYNYVNFTMSTWTNITMSTSENYTNYLDMDRTPYYEYYSDGTYNYQYLSTSSMESTGDGTYLLSTTWDNATETTTISDNWTGTEGKVYAVAGGTTISQALSGLPNETYTVQAIVRGAEGKSIKLSLNENDTTETLYGTAANSTSTVNTFGRVELLETGANNGWIKIEGTATITDNSLTISLTSDGDYQVSDVTLLYKANQEGYYWTTINNMDSYVDMSDTTEWASYYTSHYTSPEYNKFSFFDRGLNKNRVIYAHPLTVIALDAGVADDDSHIHPCNVAVREYEYQATTYNSSSSSNSSYYQFTLLDSYTCPLLSLVDTDGSAWENKHTFGIPTDFTATAVKYTRNYKAGQSITAVFPFAMSDTELESYYGTNTVYKLSSITNTAANFTSYNSTTANEPFLVKTPTISGEQTLSLEGKTIEATTDGATVSVDGGSMVGVYEQTAWSADDVATLADNNTAIYMFNAQSSTGQYGKLSSRGGDIRPFRSYLQVTGSATAAKLDVTFDDVANGINGIETSEDSSVRDVYNLEGIKVGTSDNINNLPKGIYIVNGKKIIVR